MTGNDSANGDSTGSEHVPDVPDRSRLPGTPASAIDRRDYLKAVGAAGVAGSLAGASSGTAAAQEDWEAQADERIQEHRTGDLEVRVEDEAGNPIPDADVDVAMQEHEFGFGTAVNARTFADASDDDPYREWIPELFNTAVLENMHKWRFWEDDQAEEERGNRESRADLTTDWLLEQGLEVRGHTCVWGATQHAAVPDDVQQAIDQRDEETIRTRTMDHIERIIEHYGDKITEWEVVNEALHEHALQVGVYGDQIDQNEPWTGDVVPWTSELLADWYLHAQDVAEQYDVGIAVNDYNTLAGAWPYTQDWYPAQIEHLIDSGVDLDGIGFQGHVAARTNPVGQQEDGDPDERMSYEQINEVLDLYADYDAGLRITEFDTYEGNDWSGDEEKADALYTYLKTAFAHPAVDDFLVWGYWDGRHWQDDAPFFYEDWSEKPALDVWRNLVLDEWWTEETGTTGSDGTFGLSAFLGEHEVTVSTSEETVTETVEVTDADGTTELVVTAEGESVVQCESADGGSMEVEGQTVCDLNDDGYYRDVTGDGDLDQDDVVTFFEHQHRSAWKREAFDVSGNGEVNQFDVVELFDDVLTN